MICGAWYLIKVRWWGNIHYQISWAVAFSVKNECSGATFIIRWTRLDDHLPKTILCFPKMTKWGINWYFQFRQITWRLKADGLLKIHTEQRILFGTKKYFNLKSLTGIKLRCYFYQTMLCLTIVCTCNVRVYIGWYSYILWKSQTWFPSIEINCSVCYSFSITLKYFYLLMLIKTTLDALLPFL